jgi:hypothetical protein
MLAHTKANEGNLSIETQIQSLEDVRSPRWGLGWASY